MDANQTRFLLAMGRDWAGARDKLGLPPNQGDTYNDAAAFTVLGEELQLTGHALTLSVGASTLDLASRRGAVRDPHANTYVVEGTGIRLRCCAPMGIEGSDGEWYWQGDVLLRGLAVTSADVLVAGGGPVGSSVGCLLLFDLKVEQSPRLLPLDFVPFDLASCDTSVWVLDRAGKAVYKLLLSVPPDVLPEPAAPTGFEVCTPAPLPNLKGSISLAFNLPGDLDPIGIEALPNGDVLVLYRAEPGGILRYRAGVELERSHFSALNADAPPVGHDIASNGTEVVVVMAGGRQAFSYDVTEHHLKAREKFLPMIDYGGLDVVVEAGEFWYQGGLRWLPLVVFSRPRYAEEGWIDLPVEGDDAGWDSGIFGCVWHRVMMDAGMPAGARVEVWSRASDDRADFADPERGWQKEPPLYLRPDGIELPFLQAPHLAPTRTYETLFQRATGRYLQLRLHLLSDGRSTPRIAAIRAWYPRFSYLQQYLPAAWRQDPVSASFVDRFLSNPEGLFTQIEDRVAAVELLLDPARLQADYLPWLASWFEVILLDDWNETQRRFFLRYATWFFAWRGTIRGIRAAIRLVLDCCPSEAIFEDTPGGLRVVDDYQKRPRIGRLSEARKEGAELNPDVHWEPDFGASSLHQRWKTAMTAKASEASAAAVAATTTASLLQTLALSPYPSFAPTGQEERWLRFQEQMRQRFGGATWIEEDDFWAEFLQDEAAAALLQATTYSTQAAQLSTLASSPFPVSAPAVQVEAWQEFCKAQLLFVPGTTALDADRYNRFRARRYRDHKPVPHPASTPLFSALPADRTASQSEDPLRDWYDFESLLAPMATYAHRFTVLLPTPSNEQLAEDPQYAERLRALVRRVVEVEKPAHTVFEVAFADFSFRPGEVRLGIDTLLGDPEPEIPPFKLDRDSLAAAAVAALYPARLPRTGDLFDPPLPLESL